MSVLQVNQQVYIEQKAFDPYNQTGTELQFTITKKIGRIYHISDGSAFVDFGDSKWVYPLENLHPVESDDQEEDPTGWNCGVCYGSGEDEYGGSCGHCDGWGNVDHDPSKK